MHPDIWSCAACCLLHSSIGTLTFQDQSYTGHQMQLAQFKDDEFEMRSPRICICHQSMFIGLDPLSCSCSCSPSGYYKSHVTNGKPLVTERWEINFSILPVMHWPAEPSSSGTSSCCLLSMDLVISRCDCANVGPASPVSTPCRNRGSTHPHCQSRVRHDCSGITFISATIVHKDGDRKSTRLNSSHVVTSRMPSSA